MADLFSNLGSGIRLPDARIGGSNPLPTSLAGPAGINGDPDGRYNFNGNLLDGIGPYAGPDGGRMGSDRNYQQIPHRMQHIIPKLYLPKAQYLSSNERVELSHSVDQGDIAFVIVSERVQHLVLPSTQYNGPRMQMPSRNAFVNLPTVNYLLAGLQRLSRDQDIKGIKRGAWAQLADDLQFNINNPNRLAEILKLVSTRLLPYGICAGSEHQGGKHETGLAPVQAAANHVTTMTVDGQNRDLVNYWRASNISAGDILIFRLEKVHTKQFTLNHYYKQMVFEDFGSQQVCYQLVPDVFRMSYDPQMTLDQKKLQPPLNHHYKDLNDNAQYDYRIDGYWKIGQMFHHRNAHDMECNNYSDDKVFLRGQLMQITFAPTWIQLGERRSLTNKPNPNTQMGLAGHDNDSKKRKAEEDEMKRRKLMRPKHSGTNPSGGNPYGGVVVVPAPVYTGRQRCEQLFTRLEALDTRNEWKRQVRELQADGSIENFMSIARFITDPRNSYNVPTENFPLFDLWNQIDTLLRDPVTDINDTSTWNLPRVHYSDDQKRIQCILYKIKDDLSHVRFVDIRERDVNRLITDAETLQTTYNLVYTDKAQVLTQIDAINVNLTNLSRDATRAGNADDAAGYIAHIVRWTRIRDALANNLETPMAGIDFDAMTVDWTHAASGNPLMFQAHFEAEELFDANETVLPGNVIPPSSNQASSNSTSDNGSMPPPKPKIVVRKAADVMESGGSKGGSSKKSNKNGGLFSRRKETDNDTS
tara:strand:- start:17595 stop:19859 length:2265 start_codon:yes stop_codon:yes gene_type:complete